MRKSKRKHLLKHQVYPERGWGAVGQGGLTRVLLGAPQGQLCGWSVGWEGRLWCHGHILVPQLVFLSGGRRMGTAASTANLLDDVEGHAYGKECCATLCWVCRAWHGWVPWCLAPHRPRAGSGVSAWQKYPCGPKPPSSALRRVLVETPQVPLGILSLSKETLPWGKLGCLPWGSSWSWDRGAVVSWCGGGYSPRLPLPFR